MIPLEEVQEINNAQIFTASPWKQPLDQTVLTIQSQTNFLTIRPTLFAVSQIRMKVDLSKIPDVTKDLPELRDKTISFHAPPTNPDEIIRPTPLMQATKAGFLDLNFGELCELGNQRIAPDFLTSRPTSSTNFTDTNRP